MKVLVDTCIWSQALRRENTLKNAYVQELKELIQEIRAQLIEPIRQELLSGIKSEKQFQLLRDHLRAFEDIDLMTEDYETAAEYFNTARQKGIQGSNTDFLICAVAIHRDMAIFTTDKDFEYFKTILPIELHRPREHEVRGKGLSKKS